MTIERLNTNLSPSEKIRLLNEMIMELNGKFEQGIFNKNELDQVYTDIGINRKFQRVSSVGHALGTYTGWSHVKEETGYSIWKFSPTNYTYNSLNTLYLDDVKLENRGEATTESAATFDKVFLFNGADSTYTDNTTEAGTEVGTQFDLMDATNDYLYVGHSSTFGGIKFEFHTRGSNYSNLCQYYNGATWVTLSESSHTFEDGTNDFLSDGLISYTIPGDWATTSINGQTKYWIRIYSTTTPVSTAKAYYIIPGTSVPALLALSSDEISQEQWAWCTYSSSIYVTIRNAGASEFEGDFFITSASTTTNKQNYFIYNHHYKLDYQDSTYAAVLVPDFKSVGIETPTSSEDVTMFFTQSAITITKMVAVLTGSASPSVTWTVRHSTDRNASGNEVVTGGTTTTSTTTGSVVTSFNDETIPANSFVWLETTAQSGTVNSINVTVFYE